MYTLTRMGLNENLELIYHFTGKAESISSEPYFSPLIICMMPTQQLIKINKDYVKSVLQF